MKARRTLRFVREDGAWPGDDESNGRSMHEGIWQFLDRARGAGRSLSPPMKLLAIDTAANLCAACVYDETQVGEAGRVVLDLGKGHAERLMEVIGDALAEAGATYEDLDAVAVSVGPGSFTGVRVGVAAARGLALALAIPAIGVTTLEALAEEARALHPRRPVLAVIDAGRGDVYATAFAPDGECLMDPVALPHADAAALAAGMDERASGLVLTGSAARGLATGTGRVFTIAGEAATADISTYAAIAAARASGPVNPPRPLYLRDADARPQTGFSLPRKDET